MTELKKQVPSKMTFAAGVVLVKASAGVEVFPARPAREMGRSAFLKAMSRCFESLSQKLKTPSLPAVAKVPRWWKQIALTCVWTKRAVVKFSGTPVLQNARRRGRRRADLEGRRAAKTDVSARVARTA